MNENNVIPLYGEFVHDQPTAEYLEEVKALELSECIVIGHMESGELFVGGNTSDFERLVFLMFRANKEMDRIEARFPTLFHEVKDM
ncbi:MAG: hypothetical protein CBB87_08105 [Micavibrio sp. TMED27]|nr:hypothetical protein [Micavibrio sp.]OUT90633.1 MAG: hypothetical protein CBB87_08105 [Micavibrio sp. TMED27]|tara:strand:- start:2076 stop:2333 length:258 start_codon:yes stop_codon:yes gene_type:complete